VKFYPQEDLIDCQIMCDEKLEDDPQ